MSALSGPTLGELTAFPSMQTQLIPTRRRAAARRHPRACFPPIKLAVVAALLASSSVGCDTATPHGPWWQQNLGLWRAIDPQQRIVAEFSLDYYDTTLSGSHSWTGSGRIASPLSGEWKETSHGLQIGISATDDVEMWLNPADGVPETRGMALRSDSVLIALRSADFELRWMFVGRFASADRIIGRLSQTESGAVFDTELIRIGAWELGGEPMTARFDYSNTLYFRGAAGPPFGMIAVEGSPGSWRLQTGSWRLNDQVGVPVSFERLN